MPVVDDFSVTIHAITADRGNFARNRQRCVWQGDAVKFQFQPAFAPEMAWLLGLGQMPRKISAPWEHSLAELLPATRVANERVAHYSGSGREIWFIQRTLEKTSSGNDGFFRLCCGPSRQTENDGNK